MTDMQEERERLDVDMLARAIVENNARWEVREPSFPPAELGRRLGVVLDEQRLQEHRERQQVDMVQVVAEFLTKPAPGERAPQEVNEIVGSLLDRTQVDVIPAHIGLRYPFPPWFFVVDWRNRKGRNNVTPVKDQGGCGSCVAFGTTATLESMVLIEHDVPLDLSEAELLFCGGGSCGGWWPDSAVTYLQNKGIAHESCFPYIDHNMPCVTCAERDGEAVAIANNVVIWDQVQRKQYLANVGPMMCVFQVFSDFGWYHNGVYTHVTGGLRGLHCVEVIGYNNLLGCWICKNSWGTGWGDAGFFQIAFGQCQIDTTVDPSGFPFWGISGSHWFQPWP